VVHRLNDRYAAPAAVAMNSMLRNADASYHYDLRIIHTDITPEHQEKLLLTVNKFSNASLLFVTPVEAPIIAKLFDEGAKKAHLSAETFWTLLVPNIFPDLDRCIMTDVDVLWVGDIAQFWNSAPSDDDKSWQIAGIGSVNPKAPNRIAKYYERYKERFTPAEVARIVGGIGGGLLLLNLHELRKNNMPKKFLDFAFANQDRLRQHEQDVINLVADKQIRHLALRNMVSTYLYDMSDSGEFAAGDNHFTDSEIRDALQNPIQLHFAGGARMKPWLDPSARFSGEWMREMARTDFYEEWLETETKRRKDSRERILFAIRVPFRENRKIALVWQAV
jgi:lipopolysaccharide biosynthesis glycosyltransferase